MPSYHRLGQLPEKRHTTFFRPDGKLYSEQLISSEGFSSDYHVRTVKEALFEIPKPLGVMAMGIDQLPEQIKHSPYLTGNKLARLGGVEALPAPTGKEPKAIDFEEAKKCIEAGNIWDAFALLY